MVSVNEFQKSVVLGRNKNLNVFDVQYGTSDNIATAGLNWFERVLGISITLLLILLHHDDLEFLSSFN